MTTGATLSGYGNGSSGNALDALNQPLGLAMDSLGSLYISDRENHRVIKIKEGSAVGSIAAGTGVPGNAVTQLFQPSGVHVD